MRTRAIVIGCFVVASLCRGAAAADPSFRCTFDKKGWSAKDWMPVRQLSHKRMGGWVQRSDHVENETPAGATPAELLGKKAAEAYSSMLYKKPIEGDVAVTATVEFAHRMAPCIVLAGELAPTKDGKHAYRKYIEVVVFDQGINVWRHDHTGPKPKWVKAAFARFALKPNTKYKTQVIKQGKTLTIKIAGHEFGYQDEHLLEKVHVGITGCEGLNRFYDFSIAKPAK